MSASNLTANLDDEILDEITLEAFLQYVDRPDNRDRRFELIENQIYMLQSPSSLHARILTYLSGVLFNYLNGKRCELFNALDVRLLGVHKKNNVFCPDLFINCNPDRIKKNYCDGAPEFVLEVTSPSTMDRDYGVKRWLYMAHGVREYWIVDPAAEKITVCALDIESGDLIEKHYHFNQTIPVGLFTDLAVDFSPIQEIVKQV